MLRACLSRGWPRPCDLDVRDPRPGHGEAVGLPGEQGWLCLQMLRLLAETVREWAAGQNQLVSHSGFSEGSPLATG